jgi:hypothetical protein
MAVTVKVTVSAIKVNKIKISSAYQEYFLNQLQYVKSLVQ